MTYFIKNGNTFRPTDESNVDIHTLLPAGNYVIKTDAFGNMFFETVDKFEFKTKRYGENPRWTRRILDTFYSRNSGTGVMLAGEKGSGKSLLARTISMDALNENVPTIIINAPWAGDAFNTLIQSIEQPAIILFDEFEKVYDREKQEQILTLLDGVFPSKKLFVFTCNDKWRVDQHMRNRPGRIFYMIEFKGLSPEFIEEYCTDNLLNTSYIPQIIKAASFFAEFNFDMLKALVEEMNRYGESPADALTILNVRPEFDDRKVGYAVTILRGTQVFRTHSSLYSGNPLQMNNEDFAYADPDEEDEESDDFNYATIAIAPSGITRSTNRSMTNWKYLYVSKEDMVEMSGGRFIFQKDGLTLRLDRVKETTKPTWYDSL